MENIYPDKGGKPSKMFSGSSTSGPHKDVLAGAMAHSRGNASKPVKTKSEGSGAQGLRHQKPPGTKR